MSIYRSLPDHPSLEHLRGQAKDLLAAARDKQPEALRRFEAAHPRSREVLAGEPKLSDAQLVLAREYDFSSWPALHDYLSSDLSSAKPAFRQALDAGDVDRARALLDARPQLALARFAPNNDTALHLAAGANQPALAELLIERGAQLGALNSWGGSPLVAALIMGHAAVSELLVKSGAQAPTLVEAAGIGNVELMRGFWDEAGKLRPDAGSRFGYELAPGVWETRPQDPRDEREVLHEGLEYACRNGRLEAAKFMIERGANIHGAGFFGAQPLHWAAGCGQDEIVRFLVSEGADLNARDPKFDSTPFGWAREFNHPSTMNLLRELGCDPDL